ncbi:hypothetical protein ATERTT37_005234 [Aspergillus terreus]
MCNTFRVDGTDTNILKIYRMLEKSDNTPGIGTEITPGSLASTTLKHSSRLGKSKTTSQALGTSFEQHVLGGYRFLMRHYRKDAEIYIFGFSRGAYTACFLTKMLDYSGFLGPDNEEMIPIVWKTFSQLKLVRFQKSSMRTSEVFEFLKASREILCRAAVRVKFLGVFDTVNSVAEFEVDNEFDNSALTTRHAVSIDERRVKFQPVLLRKYRQQTKNRIRRRHYLRPPPRETNHCKESDNTSPEEKSTPVQSAESRHGKTDKSTTVEADDPAIDQLEVWFPGCHADVGGGNKRGDEKFQLSHAPLVWMVQEAIKAGLRFDPRQVKTYDCLDNPEEDASHRAYLDALHHSSATGILNDRLQCGSSVSVTSALAWNILEHIPIKHVEIQKDGGSRTMQFPLHCGKPRGIPNDALIHVSAIRRMQHSKDYRPRNLIVGGEGKGVIKAPPEYGLGGWVPKYNIGDPTHELYVRKAAQVL